MVRWDYGSGVEVVMVRWDCGGGRDGMVGL
jgi:hypothetical protein